MPLASVWSSHIRSSATDFEMFRQRTGPVDHAAVTFVAILPFCTALQTRPCMAQPQMGVSSPPRPWLSQVRLSREWITTAMGVLGTTITPYLFFWQSALEVEEEKAEGRTTLQQRRGANDEEIRDAHFDVNVGMLFSNVVMFFIITTTALTLFEHGKTNIQTAQDAARALEPLAGHLASLLFMLGMVGTGLLAIPALAGSSAYIAAEMLSFRRQGLDELPNRAPRFYAVLIAGLVVGIALPFTGLNPIRALYWSAVLNGIVSVPLIFIVIRIANNAKIMGKWRNSLLANAWSWVTFALMGLAALALFTV